MAGNSIWKSGGLGALICIVLLVYNKMERAKTFEENGVKYQAGYYDNTTV